MKRMSCYMDQQMLVVVVGGAGPEPGGGRALDEAS